MAISSIKEPIETKPVIFSQYRIAENTRLILAMLYAHDFAVTVTICIFSKPLNQEVVNLFISRFRLLFTFKILNTSAIDRKWS